MKSIQSEVSQELREYFQSGRSPIRKASRTITLDFEGEQGEVSLGIRYVYTPSREPKSDEPGAGASVEILYALVGDVDVMFMLPKEVTSALCESILEEHV